MKRKNSKKNSSPEVSKFSKADNPTEVGAFVKRKVPKIIDKPIVNPVKTVKSKNTNSQSIIKEKVAEIKSKVEREVVLKAINVLQQLSKISAQKKNGLFDEDKSIVLQIDCVKIPDCVSRKLRFNLPHWLVTDTSEICLFVSDLKKGRNVDHEPTIQHYEDLLKEKGIKIINSVIPIRQVRVEYDQMEMKRRLLTQYDFFLADAKVSGLLAHKLGKTFYRKKQLPTPIRMDSKDLKKAIEYALHRTVMNLHGTGHTYSMNVASSKHSTEEAYENIQAILLQLTNQFPGGWDNIRSLYIKHPMSMAIPIYMTLKNKNSVENVVIQPLRPVNDVVEGELSTILGAKVKVHPRGDVEIDVERSDGEYSDIDYDEVPVKRAKKDPAMKNKIDKNNSNKTKTTNKFASQIDDSEKSEDNDSDAGDLSQNNEESDYNSEEKSDIEDQSQNVNEESDDDKSGDSDDDDDNSEEDKSAIEDLSQNVNEESDENDEDDDGENVSDDSENSE